jgi:molybdopterin converting factor small subunit
MTHPEFMRVRVCFFSYFKELTGCAEHMETIPPRSTIGDLLTQLFIRFPKLEPMKKSTLIAVGIEYQDRNYILKEGEEVSLFPPVQGG